MVLAIVFSWRLSTGSIPLPFLSSHIEAKLEALEIGLEVNIGEVVLFWRGWGNPIELSVQDVEIIKTNNTLRSKVPEILFALSEIALIKGEIAPRTIKLIRPEIIIKKGSETKLEQNLTENRPLVEQLEGIKLFYFLSNLTEDKTFRYLEKLYLRESKIIIRGHEQDLFWSPASEVELFWDSFGTRGKFSFLLENDKDLSNLEVLLSYRKITNILQLTADFGKISLAPIAPIFQDLVPLRVFNVPFSGNIFLEIPLDGRGEKFGFDLKGEEGTLNLPFLFSEPIQIQDVSFRGTYTGKTKITEIENLRVKIKPNSFVRLSQLNKHLLPLRSFSMQASYDSSSGFLNMSRFKADLSGSKITLSGIASGLTRNREIGAVVSVNMNHIPVNDIKSYWPASLGKVNRAFVLNSISSGDLRNLNLDTVFSIRKDGSLKASLVDFVAEMDGIEVKSLYPNFIVKDIIGKLKFSLKESIINLKSGKLKNLDLVDGKVLLSGFDQIDQIAVIKLKIIGAVSEKINFIKTHSINLTTNLKNFSNVIKGEAETKLDASFNLGGDLNLENIIFSIQSKIKNFRLLGLFGDSEIRSDLIDIKATNDKMIVSGDLSLDATPIRLVWEEMFTRKSLFKSQFKLLVSIKDSNDINYSAFNLPISLKNYFKGALDAEVQITNFDGQNQKIKIRTDLTQANLLVPGLNWRKGIGQVAQGGVDFSRRNGSVLGSPSFFFKAKDFRIKGHANYGERGILLQYVEFDEMSHGLSNFKAKVIPREEGPWEVRVSGHSFDFASKWEEIGAEKETSKNDSRHFPNLSLYLDVDNVWLTKKNSLTDFSGEFFYNNNRWDKIQIKAKINGDTSFVMSVEPNMKGDRVLNITSNNAGQTLQFFDFFGEMLGGELNVTGVYDDSVMDEPLSGFVEIKNFRVVNTPVLTRMLSILSLTGILEALEGEGLSFKKLEVPFIFHQNIFRVDSARATGPSLGFTASGKVQNLTKMIYLEGTIVPAYALNSVFGRLPLLGKLLTGGEKGGGLFAANYKLSGLIDNPDVSVNPLSALTPGILRNVFDIFDGLDESTRDSKKNGNNVRSVK